MDLHYLADLFGTWVETDRVVIHLAERVTSGLYVWNLHYFVYLIRTWIEVDGVVIPLDENVPSGLYVWISITLLICLGLE